MTEVLEYSACKIVIRLETSGPWKECWELVTLLTPAPFRNQGHATRAMTKLCAEADLVGRRIHVTARPVETNGISESELHKFYEKFGFEYYPGVGRAALHSMLRKPQH